MTKLIGIAVAILALSGPVMAAPGGQGKGKGQAMSACAKQWNAYKEAHNIKGQGTGRAHQKFMSDCLTTPVKPDPVTPAVR